MRVRWTWALAAVVVLGLGSGVWHALSTRKTQQEAVAAAGQEPQAALILSASDVLPLQPRELQLGLPLTGTLHAVNTAVVKARVPGELQQLSVREGDRVQAGQVLARIEATEYQARLRQAQEQADAAQAQVQIAQRQWDNNRALVEQGFISKTALDTSQSSLNAARASYQAAVAAVDVARKAVADTVLASPLGGWVSQRLAQPGEKLPVDARIVEIVDLSHIELEAAVSASDAAQVQVGQPARIKAEGSSDWIPARVARINPSTQPGSRSVLVYLSVTPAPTLRHGLFAEGLLGQGSQRLPAVPLSAVRTDQPSPYVQWIREGQVAHQNVTLGARGTDAQGTPWVAVSGLPVGAQVLVGPVGPLRAGTPVRLDNAPAPAASAPVSAAAAR